jgi:hypothetical protein
MPIFKATDKGLTSLRQVQPGPDLYELEIEKLLWDNLEAFYAEDLFPISRQPQIPTGGRPDVVAIDSSGSVVVFEVKRSIERSQLAQCLEYAGWARKTSLDELSRLYHKNADQFFADWMAFTGTTSPVLVNDKPILVLVAQDFDNRTHEALKFLKDNQVPIHEVPVRVYVGENNARFYNIDSEYDDAGELEPPDDPKPIRQYRYMGRRVHVLDLIEAGFLEVEEKIEFVRQSEGAKDVATIMADGRICDSSGRVHETLSRAAIELGKGNAYPGWDVWTAPGRGGRRLFDIREEFMKSIEKAVDE